MTGTLDRRGFFRRLGGLVPDGATHSSAPVDTTEHSIDWLGDEDSAIAQLNEARPFLMEDARNAGIDTAGKTELQILRELFARAGGPPGEGNALVRTCAQGEQS